MPPQFSQTRIVEFVETDMGGIVHFSNFFRWMEACETAYLRSLGVSLVLFSASDFVGWPRVKVSCEYRAPLRFGDTFEVRLFVKKIGTRAVTYVFHFRKGGVLVANGELTAVCVKADGRGGIVSQPVPDGIRSKIIIAPESAWKA